MPAAREAIAVRHARGITLLEVLISCGLLLVGLSAIAALLPAAGFRLQQATMEDRAAVLLSNACAEVSNRGLVAADSFASGTVAGTVRMLVMGQILGRLPMYGPLPSGRSADEYCTAPPAATLARCGSPRTFLLEDALTYERPRYSDSPVNAFVHDAAGVGPRAFQAGMCWGATVTPRAFPVTAGGKAVLSIAVFKRGNSAQGTADDKALALPLKRVGSVYEVDLVASDTLLAGCSWLLALPASPDEAPRWFRIMSSWDWQTPTGRTRRLVLRNQHEFEELTRTSESGATATVFAFEGLVRVEERLVTIR
jgi:hypothetical protein